MIRGNIYLGENHKKWFNAPYDSTCPLDDQLRALHMQAASLFPGQPPERVTLRDVEVLSR